MHRGTGQIHMVTAVEELHKATSWCEAAGQTQAILRVTSSGGGEQCLFFHCRNAVAELLPHQPTAERKHCRLPCHSQLLSPHFRPFWRKTPNKNREVDHFGLAPWEMLFARLVCAGWAQCPGRTSTVLEQRCPLKNNNKKSGLLRLQAELLVIGNH